MKVLFLTRKKEGVGGVEKHVREVARILETRGYEIEVLDEPSFMRKKLHIWRWLWKNRVSIKRNEIIHAHDVAFWYLPFRFIYPNKKFYITFHGWEGKFPVPWKNKLVRKISERLARGNICVGDYIKKYYGARPDYVTYGAVKC